MFDFLNIKCSLKNVALFIFLLCVCTNKSFSQTDSSFQFIKLIKGNFSNFSVDNLENIFVITNGNQLKKIDTKGDSVGVFNDVKHYGSLYSIDVSNPLKIVLYYKDFATIVILDRLLNVRNTIDLHKQNIFWVQTLATAYDNNIWLIDEEDAKIKKIDDAGNLLQESIDLRIILDTVPTPSQLIDKNNFIYLYDAEKGIYVFDYYGTFKNKMAFLNWSNVAISAKNIYGFSNNTLHTYQLNSFNVQDYILPDIFLNYLSIKISNDKLYLLKNDGIYIYQIKKKN